MIKLALAAVVEGRELDAPTMAAVMEAILAGTATPPQIAALAVALRMRGETDDELATAATVLRAHCDRVDFDGVGPLLDTCGTGGDGLGTFNVSTAAAIVAAACGVRVAKHGNRAVSSRCGSADVLSALGVRIDAPMATRRRCLEQLGITFLFAPLHHQAMRHAAPVRRDLGLRTFFNLLGPLANPAGATHQLLGIYDRGRLSQMAEVLNLLGSERAWVVHGHGGLDEISPSGPTTVAVLEGASVRTIELLPSDFGLAAAEDDALAGGDAATNARILTSVLAGEPVPARSAVLINAAAALCVAGVATRPAEATEIARTAIDGGRAMALLEQWVAQSWDETEDADGPSDGEP